MTADDKKEKIRKFLGELLLARGDSNPFEDADALYVRGRIDSLDIIELIGFLEADFGLDLSTFAFDPSAVDSVDAIVALTARERPVP